MHRPQCSAGGEKDALMRLPAFLTAYLCVLCTCSPLFATPLTLEEAVAKAKTANPHLRALRHDVAIGDQQVKQAQAQWLPRLDMAGGWTALRDPQAMALSGMAAMETQDKHYRFGSVAAQQTLWDFGRRQSHTKAMEALRDATTHAVLDRSQDVTFEVITTYLGLLHNASRIQSLNREEKTVVEHRRVAQALYEAGSVTRNDLLQADVRLAAVKHHLLAAITNENTQYQHLAFLIGSTENDRPNLVPPQTVSVAVHDENPLRLVADRPDLRSYRFRIQASDNLAEEQKQRFYPEFFVRVSADYLENSHLREQTMLSGTIGLSINLFDGFASSAARAKALLERDRLRDQLVAQERQAVLELTTARQILTLARERIAVTQKAIVQAEENLRINKNRYQERVGTASDVLDAQSLLSQTEADNMAAIYDYHLALARLKRATGTL